MVIFMGITKNYLSEIDTFALSSKERLLPKEALCKDGVEVGEVSSFCSSFPPMALSGPAAIHVKARRLSRVLGPAR